MAGLDYKQLQAINKGVETQKKNTEINEEK